MTRGITDAIRRASPIGMIALLLLISGCVAVEDNVDQGYVTGKHIGRNNVAFTTADVRSVIERKRAQDNDPSSKVICSEPSPDAAMAIALLSKLKADVTTTAGDAVTNKIGGEFEHSVTQAISQLAGRSVAVQALRDGTYRACEAYANGAIDKEEYALILSQYGDVLSTLILAENAEKTGIPSIAGNYVAYSLPRLTHTMFVSCARNGASTQRNAYLDSFCANIANTDVLGKLLVDLKKAMPEPYQPKAADDKGKTAATAPESWKVKFAHGDVPSLEGYVVLYTAISTLKGGTAKITIIGHADQTVPKKGKSNETIALERAGKVAEIMRDNGIDTTRIVWGASPNTQPFERLAEITVEKPAAK